MGRNYLTGRDGDRINAVLAAAGYNFSLLLRWFEEFLRVLSLILWHALLAGPASPNPVPQNVLHGRRFSRQKAIPLILTLTLVITVLVLVSMTDAPSLPATYIR